MRSLVRVGVVAVLLGATTATWAGGEDALKGEVKIDGSSTVYLITQAVATEFKKQYPNVNISVGISGTGGGFKKFSAGETDLSDASRAIKPGEAAKCKENGIEFFELQVGWDGIAVIINKENTWATKLTAAQLKKIWMPDDGDFKNAKKWSDLDPRWPNEEIKLFGPGADSGTFDYFTEAINGKEKLVRTDFEASEDDNVIIKGVERNKYGMGYLGVAYYTAHKDKLNVVAVSAKEGAPFVEPTPETVLSKKYTPLSRPLFLYVKNSSLKRPEVREFISFYMRRSELAGKVGYVQLSTRQLFTQREKLDKALKSVGAP